MKGLRLSKSLIDVNQSKTRICNDDEISKPDTTLHPKKSQSLSPHVYINQRLVSHVLGDHPSFRPEYLKRSTIGL